LGFEKTYDYDDVPTIKKFNEDNRFFRAIMGPVGCLPNYTEYLTKSGWRRIDEYSGEEIAQWDESGRIQFVIPGYIVLPEEKMLLFEHRYFSMCLSAEHRVPHYNYEGKFSVKTAEEIFQHPSRIEIPTTFTGHSTDSLGMSDAMIRFAVMMHADGHYPKAGQRAYVSLRKERKKIRLREILSELGVVWKEAVYSKRPTETVFGFVPPYIGKRFAGKWWGASWRELSVISEEILLWDGTVTSEGEHRFSTTHKEDADFIQYACHATGRRATISVAKDKRNDDWSVGYVVFIRVADNQKNKVYAGGEMTRSIVPAPDGMKYCFTVPSGFFVVRQHNSIFITGNSGKSSGCVAEIIDRGIAQEPSDDGVRRTRWAVVRHSYRALLDTTMETLFMWLPPEHFGTFSVTNFQYNINKITLPDGTKVDIEIIFRALDKPEQVRNLLSLELTGAWFNEVREVAWIIMENMEHRVGRYPSKEVHGTHPTWHGIIADTNPPDVDSTFHHFFEEKVPKDPILQAKYVLYKQPSGRSAEAENKRHLIPTYYDSLMIGKEPEFIKVYVDGDYGYIRDGKPVYGNYVDHLHCAEADIRPVHGVPVIIGMDFALNPAAVFSQLLPNGNFNIIKEIVGVDMGLRRFINDLMRPYIFSDLRGFEIIIAGDPAGVKRTDNDERSSFDELRMQGFPAIPAHTNSFLARYNAVDSILTKMVKGKPALQLSPGCKVLRKGFMGEYKLKKYRGFGEDKYSDIPNKNEYSHIHDALQYSCMISDHGEQVARSYQHMGSRYASPPTPRPSMSGWT
jgi:hypothetical protein